MSNIDKKVYEIYSKKYDVKGEIHDYGFLIKLIFTYQGKEKEIALSRPFPDSGEEAFKSLGEKSIDSYIEKLLSGEIKERRLMLHDWYLDEHQDRESGESSIIAHGIVTGHTKLADSIDIHTSKVEKVSMNSETGEAEIRTRNSVYYCPLAYCNFRKQDKFPHLIYDYEQMKCDYQDKRLRPSIEPGKILLVLSNFCEFYFDSLYYMPEGESEIIEYTAYPHIGTFQDSFLIETDEENIDLRYFPHFQNIEFYSQHTDGKSLFIENIGDTTLYAKTSCGVLRLDPGERKEVIKDNTEKEDIVLPGGDLYPAGIIE